MSRTNVSQEESRHWETYWRADAGQNAAVSGDAPGDLFDALWLEFFKSAFARHNHARLIDLACGAGVVLDRAADMLSSVKCHSADFCGVDYAFSAAEAVNRKAPPRHASRFGATASVSQLPFRDASFDIVVSQFGIEYAGTEAFGEAARVLAPGGAAQFIIHYRGGGIDRECSGNARVLRDVLDAGFFNVGLDAVSGPNYEASAVELQRIMTGLAAHLDGEPLAAKQLVARLLPDMATLVGRRHAYRLEDAAGWIEAMRREVVRYAERMTAMTDCALDIGGVRSAAQFFKDVGANVEEPSALTPGGKTEPAAWLVKAERPA